MFELRLLAPARSAEAASDALIDELGALSVSVEDADAGTQAEQPMFGEPGMPLAGSWERSSLQALFDDESGAATAAAVLLAQPWARDIEFAFLRAVPDQDWVRVTQSQFSPVEVTPDFWIVPTWHEVPAAARQHIRLDPGLAFGTGTHATTRMCLRWMALADRSGKSGWPRVLDYGCGSGILAICAALHGAAEVDAVDIDPAAVRATQDNAQANRVDVRAGLPDAAQGRYDLVLANILSTPLKLLAPLLCAHVAAGGSLVLAGILERQAEEVAASYSAEIALQVSESLEGWVLLTGCRA